MGPLHFYSSRSDFRERGGREDKEEDGEEENKYYGTFPSQIVSYKTGENPADFQPGNSKGANK